MKEETAHWVHLVQKLHYTNGSNVECVYIKIDIIIIRVIDYAKQDLIPYPFYYLYLCKQVLISTKIHILVREQNR